MKYLNMLHFYQVNIWKIQLLSFYIKINIKFSVKISDNKE